VTSGRTLRQGGREARRAFGLDTDDHDLGALSLDRRANARDQSAAADRDDDRLDIRCLLEDFEPHRPLTCDHRLIVERMDEREAVARRDFARMRARFGEVGAMQDHSGAQMAAVGDLDQRREQRHHDGRRNAEQTGVVRDALRVVAGGGGDDAALALPARQLRERVTRAALLEAACTLQIVEFAIDMRARELRQRDRFDAG